MIYEQRRVVIKRHALEAYRALLTDRLWPSLTRQGGHPLVLLSGLVGTPPEETYSFVGYSSLAEWERLQIVGPRLARERESIWGDLADDLEERCALVQEEQVLLLQPVDDRPSHPVPVDIRRPLYGFRRFQLHSEDWPEFVRSSQTIWDSWEDRLDSVILGMFRGLAITEPLPVSLMTGYRSPSHWEQTRALFKGGASDRPSDVSEADWANIVRDYRLRNLELPITSHVCLMQAHWPKD